MISSKVMRDDTYSNKSWSVVAQKMFNLQEINQMEKEMCNYLEWELTAANPMLSSFETAVKRDFRKQKPTYPAYPTVLCQVDQDLPELVERKVKGLLTLEKFTSISDRIIAWANKSEKEKDGRTLIQAIRLVYEKAMDEATWSEMYARLCTGRKMMEQIGTQANVQDDGIKNSEGKPITGTVKLTFPN